MRSILNGREKPVFKENYSLGRNKLLDLNKPGNQDSDKKPGKTSTGRKPREAKEHLVSDTMTVFPEGVDRRLCTHHRFQSGWRVVDLRYDIRDLHRSAVAAGSPQQPLRIGIGCDSDSWVSALLDWRVAGERHQDHELLHGT